MIGIDLGSRFVKVCKIVDNTKKSDELSIVSAMMMISSLDASSQKVALMSLLRKLKIGDDSCFLAVGGKEIINRDIVLSNSMDKKSLKSAVMLEAEQSITEDLGNMFSSYAVTKNVSSTECNVLFSAVPKEKIYPKFSLVNSLQNINVAGVTMESLALARAFSVFGPAYKNTESIILINIGHSISNIVVFNNKELIFTRDIDFGGKDNTKDIANFYTIPEKLAEEIKRRADLRQEINFNMKNILKKSTATLIETIFRTIEHCVTRQYILAVDRIVITGGGALIEGMDSFIEDTLGIPTDRWNPLADNKVAGYVNKDNGYFLPVSLGLALEKELE